MSHPILNNQLLSKLGANFTRAFEIAAISGHALYITIEDPSEEPEDILRLEADQQFIRKVIQENFNTETLKVKVAEKPGHRVMNMCVSRPHFDTLYATNFEDINTIFSRIVKYRSFINPKEIRSPEEYEILLRNFYNRVLSITGVLNAIELSEIIAKMDNSKTIGIEHLAEAINYQL